MKKRLTKRELNRRIVLGIAFLLIQIYLFYIFYRIGIGFVRNPPDVILTIKELTTLGYLLLGFDFIIVALLFGICISFTVNRLIGTIKKRRSR